MENFIWGDFPKVRFSLREIFIEVEFPMGRISYGENFLWGEFPKVRFSLREIFIEGDFH